MKKIFTILLLAVLFSMDVFAQQAAYPEKGEGVNLFLKRFNRTKARDRAKFIELNKGKFDKNGGLKLGVKYLLPPANNEGYEPLFGKKLSKYAVESEELNGACFYIISGHGGPDPGAIGVLQGKQLHEDEYAYDIALRLARCLMMKGAKVHVIVQDAKDGIRDDKFLTNSSRETCMGYTIPLNQTERLQQRCHKINYLNGKDTEKYRRAVFIHLDSRNEKERIDVFFYHFGGSTKGKRLADNLRKTFDEKYNRHQPSRGFTGTVSERNLYVLRHADPVSVFLELGNIRNKYDQQRFLLKNNRQALANWVCEGLVNDYKQSMKKK